jgi:hypothetical protein
MIFNQNNIFIFASLFIELNERVNIMARIAGVSVEKNTKGFAHYIRINLYKHADLIPIFKEKGFIEEESPYNKKFVAKIRETETQPSIDIDLSKYGIKV